MKTPLILTIGNPILRRKCRPVSKAEIRSPEFQRFLRSMIGTMRRFRGIGLAANQMGARKRVFVMGCHENSRYPNQNGFQLQVYINPRIVKRSKKISSDWEGCLSIPGYRGKVSRAETVVLEAMDADGQRIIKPAKGFEARVIQHELDHLDGFLYLDRMMGLRSLTHVDEFNRLFHAGVRDE